MTADQQGVVEYPPQPLQGATHGRLAQADSGGGSRDVTFLEEGGQGRQQVEVDSSNMRLLHTNDIRNSFHKSQLYQQAGSNGPRYQRNDRKSPMRYIALEEAFYIPELGERQPMPNDGPTRLPSRWNAEVAERFAARLPDVAEYRLPEMDAAGIDMQILSLTVPGLQVDIEPELATKNARFANDYTAEMVAKHPDRFGAFAALPLQDPAAAAAELERAVTELGCAARWLTTAYTAPAGAISTHPNTTRCGRRSNR